MHKKNSDESGIVLLAKQPGITSFSSLFAVKKSLATSKVGHTGTLDSFAQGLLVVCVGNLTRLASHITAFDKTYEAVIEFGKETDTLDPTGIVIKTSSLPTLDQLQKALNAFTGKLMQEPPSFSALHINGKRASDLIRSGTQVELAKRPIQVYKAELLETVLEDDKVHYARVLFEVSKGTYIRSLARDIANSIGSSAHLIGLLRTKVGLFDIQDAAGHELLKPFKISNILQTLNTHFECDLKKDNFEYISEQIKIKKQQMTKQIAILSGLKPLTIKQEFEKDFSNGRPLKLNMFLCNENFINQKYAIFSELEKFFGVIQYKENRFVYEYVISQKNVI